MIKLELWLCVSETGYGTVVSDEQMKDLTLTKLILFRFMVLRGWHPLALG